MQAITTHESPLVAGGEMFQRKKPQSFFEARSSTIRPPSIATDIIDTEFEDSDIEDDYSPKRSFESDESRRKSQTTVSSYDEAPTPDSSRGGKSRRQFEIRFKPVEGPRGPHLFRSSQTSAELDFEYALQMSPMLPEEAPSRTETAVSQNTVTQNRPPDFSIDAALATLEDDDYNDTYPEAYIRTWNTRQVIDWMCSKDVDAPVIDCFELNDINGTALLDLQFDHLKELDIQSLGKRLALWNEICKLRGGESSISREPTPFQDVERPSTTIPRTSSGQSRNASSSSTNDNINPTTPTSGKKRRGRKPSKHHDIITPAESVSIVAIEQLLPKPHKCNKGERCAKWRKQQRELKQLQDEHGIGRFPISPTKGGHIFVAGDPGNAKSANNIVPNVHKQQQHEDPFRPSSDAVPSLVASSDLLGPGQLPEFALNEQYLQHMQSRDPQDNVRQFLNFQHLRGPVNEPATPPAELAAPGSMGRSGSAPSFPAQHHQAYPSLSPPDRSHTAGPRGSHKTLPRLDIPRSASAAPNYNNLASPGHIVSACRTASPDHMTPTCRTASPHDVYRLGTPASELDVAVTAVPVGPVARDTSQSVPPNMQYHQQKPLSRSVSARNVAPTDWRRRSMALPAVKEGEVFTPPSARITPTARPSLSSNNSSSESSSSPSRKPTVSDPAKHDATTQYFGYGPDCTHVGWMKKRRTKMLRHEWQDAHFRLKGTQLAMHDSARLQSVPKDTINVENYAVTCSTMASGNKLSAAMKAFQFRNTNSPEKQGNKQGVTDPTAFAFQLTPSERRIAASTKTHHFAVRSKDDRIDWMRDIMLAKAKEHKARGYDVEVNGVQA